MSNPSPANVARRVLAAAASKLDVRPADLVRGADVPSRALPGPALNRVCHPDAWNDPEWAAVNRVIGMDPTLIHRKAFEWTQCIYGLERLGVLGDRSRVLGVGAGHECVLYHLANRAGMVVATDLYGGHFLDTPEAEADPDFLTDMGKYAPFPYRQDRLVGIPADGTRLPFAARSFDVVYSLSSIEHFGGHGAAQGAMREIARVLRPGGVACVATELVLVGDGHVEYFTRAELDELVDASGLVPVEQLDDRPLPQELMDDPVRIPDIDRNPHVVLGLGDLRWTSVVVFLRKPRIGDYVRWQAAAWAPRSRRVS